MAEEDVISFELHRNNIHKAENVLYPLIASLGILANAFVVMVILVTERSRSHRTVANTFVMNLAIADILFLIALPFYTPLFHENGYPFHVVACKLLEAMKHISYHSSILFLTGMSVDRYMAIVHSLRSLEYRTQRNARIACSVLWIASIVTSVPIIVFSKLEGVISENGTFVGKTAQCVQVFPGVQEQHFATITDLLGGGDIGEEDYSGFDDFDYIASSGDDDFSYYLPDNLTAQNSIGKKEKTCEAHYANKDKPSFKIWQYFTLIAFFVIPITIILFCYFKIWRATAIRTVRSQNAAGNQDRQSLQPNQNQPKQKLTWKQIQSKVTIMVAVLVSAFILSWLPFQIWIILTLPPGVKVSASHHCDIINVVVTMLAWSNSLMNPILYSITSENFRKRAKTTLFFIRYGYRRTMRMSVTRTSRTGLRTEKTDMMMHSMPHGISPKNDRENDKNDTQISPPPTPIEEGPPASRFGAESNDV